jgi:hypothetical protein
MAWHLKKSDDSSRVAWLRPRGRAGFRLAIADHRSPGNRPPATPWRSFPVFLAFAPAVAFPITDAVSVVHGQTVPGRQALENAAAVKEWRIAQPTPNQRVDARHAETRQEVGSRPAAEGDTPVDQASYRSYPTPWDEEAPVELLPLDLGATSVGCDGRAGCGCDSCDGPSYDHGMGQGGAIMSAAGPGASVWFSAEYLHWTIAGSELPPLVRSSPGGTGIAQTGVLNEPGQTLVGGDSSDMTRPGFRLGGGFWLDDCQTRAIEVTYSGLPGKTDRDRFDEFSHPLLGRPVFDTELPGESAMLVAYPGIMAGNITVSRSSELHHIEALRRDLRFQNRCRRIDSLVGLRFGSLEESILIEQSSRFLVPQGQIIAGTQKDLFDRFETRNRFQGVVLGFDYTERIGIVHLNARGTLGLGGNRAEVTIDGQTVTTVPGLGNATFDGGLLAQPTNIGTYRRNRFSVMPEIYTGLKMPLRNCWELSAGYHWLYWSEAAQVAGQIDRNVSQFPPETPTGALAPVGLLDTGGILIHGLQIGLSCEF